MSNRLLINYSSLLVFFISTTFANQIYARNPNIQDITQSELLERLQSENPPMLIDVRSKKELQRGYIEGAKHIYIKEFKSQLDKLAKHKDRDIVIYCYTGPRAEVAEEILLDAGFKNVFDLKGHIKEWKKNKLPLVKPDKIN